ncbi:MAG: hypothetical protein Q7R92_05280 [bacterium]|nr:hypothetical protein [bacterium]
MPKSRRKNLKVRILAKRKVKDQALESIAADAPNQEKVEREKRLLMRIGVSCIMAVFFIAWMLNLKYQFKANAGKGAKADINWNQTKAQWDQAMAQVKQGIAEIKQLQKTALNNLPKEPELTSQQINLLKGKLINEVATGTASSSKK